jgi:hypothetical protein
MLLIRRLPILALALVAALAGAEDAGARQVRQGPAAGVLSLSHWDGPIESDVFQLVLVNWGDAPIAPFTAVLTGSDCAESGRGLPAPLWLTQDVPPLGPGEERGALWSAGVTCRAYFAGDAAGALTPVEVDDEHGFAPVASRPSGRFGAPSNWMAPWGGEGDSHWFAERFWFTSGAASATVPHAGAIWEVSRTGVHRLYAWIPRHGQLNGVTKRDAQFARYRVRRPDAPWEYLGTVDQEQFGDQFAYLGHVWLEPGTQVLLGDDVGAAQEGANWVLFSALAAIPD